MENNKFAQRSDLEKQLQKVNNDIWESLVPFVLEFLTTYEEYDDDIPDLVYGMPQSKIVKGIRQKNAMYTDSDINEALRLLEKQGSITCKYYSSEGQYLYKPTWRYPIICKKENIDKKNAMVKKIDDIFD